jgi:hypothetical protein
MHAQDAKLLLSSFSDSRVISWSFSDCYPWKIYVTYFDDCGYEEKQVDSRKGFQSHFSFQCSFYGLEDAVSLEDGIWGAK